MKNKTLKQVKHQTYHLLGWLTALILLIGTVFYNYAEGWGWLNSLYFSVMTLTTVGYGDFVPTTILSKAFTMLYVMIGIGIIFSFIGNIMRTRKDE